MNWTFATNEENLGAPVWSRLNEHAGGVRSQGIFKGVSNCRRFNRSLEESQKAHRAFRRAFFIKHYMDLSF